MTEFSPFPTKFSKAFFSSVDKTCFRNEERGPLSVKKNFKKCKNCLKLAIGNITQRLSKAVDMLTSECGYSLNSLPNDKIVDQSNLKALAEGNINVIQNLKFVVGRVEVSFILLSPNTFSLDQCEMFPFGKELTISQTTDFKLYQTERVSRRKFHI